MKEIEVTPLDRINRYKYPEWVRIALALAEAYRPYVRAIFWFIVLLEVRAILEAVILRLP
jgi:hypothetical protein